MSAVNNLRPYYDQDTFNGGYSVIYKPGVGLIDTETNTPLSVSLASSIFKQTSKKGYGGGDNLGITTFGSRSHLRGIGTNASPNMTDKDYIYDLEFQEYFDWNNLSEFFKNLVWNFLKSYCKIVLSQPIDIVRLVLQVGRFDFEKDEAANVRKCRNLESLSESELYKAQRNVDSETSEDEINYFIEPEDSTKLRSPLSRSITSLSSRRKKDKNKIHPVSMHTVDILTSIASKDGPLALFKGLNASFIYQTLSHTIEAWITGFLSPFLGIPDPFFLDLTHLTDSTRSLWLSLIACVLTGLVLMPLDLIKVKLMITQFSRPFKLISEEDDSASGSAELRESYEAEKKINVRSIRDSLRHFPTSFLKSPVPSITLLTILHQLSTTMFRKVAPYVMFIRFNIDSYLSRNLYTMANLILSITEFFVKLPVENLLRKEQVRYLLQPKSTEEDRYRVLTIDNPAHDLIVNFNDSWYKDCDEEGKRLTLWRRIKMLGLFNGWRIGIMNVVGFWGYNIMKQSGTDLREERL